MQNSKMKPSRKLNQLAASLLIGLWAFTPVWVHALPMGHNIVEGKAIIEINGQVIPDTPVLLAPQVDVLVPTAEMLVAPLPQDMVITQGTPKLAIDWKSFNIDTLESVTFDQPNINSVALNRVVGADPSRILGKLSANGQVFLSNPSGVVFGPGSKVDVHGLLATTFNISDADFINGNYQFTQDSTLPLASVINHGSINAIRYVGLAAPTVVNTGSIIVADLGSVARNYGEAPVLDFNGDGLISFAVTEKVSGLLANTKGKLANDQITNTGIIRANGGKVLLTTQSARDVISNVVNHNGIIEAKTVQQENGKILLSSVKQNTAQILSSEGPAYPEKDGAILFVGGEHGNIQASGTLDASHVYMVADAVSVAANNKFLSTNNGDISIVANHLDIKGDMNSGTGDVAFTLADGGDLNIVPGNNPNGVVGTNDIKNIIARNLTLRTEGNINVKGIKATDTDRISDYVILESGSNITFETEASVFRALKLSAVTDINVKTDITTTVGDFVAKADSEVNGIGDFNLAPGAIITSARDIIVSAVLIDAVDQALQETRDLVLNGNVVGIEPRIDTNSLQQGSLSSFLTEFFENGGSGGC